MALTKDKGKRRRLRQIALLKHHNNVDFLMRMTNPQELLIRAKATLAAKAKLKRRQHIPLNNPLPGEADSIKKYVSYFMGLRDGMNVEGVPPEFNHIIPYSVFIKLAGHQDMSRANRKDACHRLSMTDKEFDDAAHSGEFLTGLFGGHRWFTALMPAGEYPCGRAICKDTLESDGEDDKYAWKCRHNLKYVLEHMSVEWVSKIGMRVWQTSWAPVMCAIGREVLLNITDGRKLSEEVASLLKMDIEALTMGEVMRALRDGKRCDCDGHGG